MVVCDSSVGRHSQEPEVIRLQAKEGHDLVFSAKKTAIMRCDFLSLKRAVVCMKECGNGIQRKHADLTRIKPNYLPWFSKKEQDVSF